MNHLDQLESESVYILREAFNRIDKLNEQLVAGRLVIEDAPALLLDMRDDPAELSHPRLVVSHQQQLVAGVVADDRRGERVRSQRPRRTAPRCRGHCPELRRLVGVDIVHRGRHPDDDAFFDRDGGIFRMLPFGRVGRER